MNSIESSVPNINFDQELSTFVIVLTSQIQGDGRGLDVLWRDGSTGVVSSMLLVKAVDGHPRLVGAQVQPVSVQ